MNSTKKTTIPNDGLSYGTPRKLEGADDLYTQTIWDETNKQGYIGLLNKAQLKKQLEKGIVWVKRKA